jgi:hypothetical protein
MKPYISTKIQAQLKAAGKPCDAAAVMVEIVRLTNRGLLEKRPTRQEETLAAELIWAISEQIGSGDPTPPDRDEVCQMLLDGFRGGRLQLCAAQEKWIVMRMPASEGEEPKVVAQWL